MSNISTQVVALNNNNSSSSNNNNNNNKSSNIDDGNYPYENGSQAMEVHDQERVIHEEPLSEGNSKKYMVMVRNSSTPFGYNKAGGNNDNIIDEGGVKYMECLKNHAAAIGGNARDGCCEFMPSGEEGTLEALKCSACHCHRNFHRKLLQGPEVIGYPTGTLIITPKAALEQRKISYKNGIITSPTSDSDDGKEGAGFMALKRPCQQAMKKRFRTKFTLEQKEKMFNFAEKAGWKIQKLDDSVIHQFCQELGIKRRVLKVWMHNNKHNSAKKSSPTT